MFGDTDLPLALIMEEILGWEKKSDQKDEEEEENQQNDTTSKRFCFTQIYYRVVQCRFSLILLGYLLKGFRRKTFL